ncbi:MAG TPA: NUDIX hydrolase [Candidatus Anaerostipes avistercoris]|uniref:NUDIX hydrolase n=1 Tax=Candidatus Anaerostipes avistercoris TaxID=2838462 RepID=A0A9D2T9A5_9FIRM|nr:NUDIX hydrolase [Candidatus Anaerostipes avistercoris]
MSKINKITPLTHVKYLNLYELEAENKFGDTHPYYVASRKNEHTMMAATKKPIPDGVIIYSLFGENNDKVIMIRQFRYPLNDYIYEFPAGLIDPGESVKETAVREMMEETGLDFTPTDCEEYLHRPHFSSAGMTDETNCTVYGYASGKPNLDHLEPNEDLSVQLVGREEAKRILKEENLSVKAYYLLLHFLQSDPKDPFAFLHI